MNRVVHAVVTAVAIIPLAVATATAQRDTLRGVRIGLTYDPGVRPGVVVLPVAGALGDSVRAIIQRDLDYSDRFVVVRLDAASSSTFRQANRLNYPLLAKLGAVAAVEASLTPRGLSVALHDVGRKGVAGRGEFALSGAGLGRGWRLGVHGVSDEIERWITGQPGIAATRIAFVRGHVMRVIDSDGAYEVELPALASAVSPSWSPDGSTIAYATYGLQSRIHVLDLTTGRSRMLAATPYQTNLTPTFSPDGRSIVYAHAGENGTDLYVTSAVGSGGDARRLSVGRGSDNASPSFSPDGRQIAFTSGRLGHPEIYLMDADGTNAELLTTFGFGDQNYRSDPDWSPDGRLIAFQSQISGRFQVLTISLRDRSIKRLTDDGENEQPAWAPDGRHLVFSSTRSGTRQLWIVDTESGRMRQLTHAAGSQLAAWSPRLTGSAHPSR